MKKLLLFLIPVIALGILTALYFIFELRILKLLSISQENIQSQNILRIILGIPSLLILSLSYWIIILKDKLNVAKSALQTHINNKSKQVDTPLEDVEVKILLILFHAPFAMPQNSLLEAVGISHQLTHFHFEELSRRNMIKHKRSISGVTRGLKLWALDHEGRRYLKDHNLTS